MKYLKHLPITDRKYNGENEEWIGILLKMMLVMQYCHMITQGVGFLTIRKSPNFIYSLIWELLGIDPVPLRVLFTCFEVGIMFYSWAGAILVNTGTLLFLNNVRIWNEYIS